MIRSTVKQADVLYSYIRVMNDYLMCAEGLQAVVGEGRQIQAINMSHG